MVEFWNGFIGVWDGLLFQIYGIDMFVLGQVMGLVISVVLLLVMVRAVFRRVVGI